MATKRVNVDFAEPVYDELEELARRKGKTKAAVLRDAIALEKWFDDTTRAGGQVMVERDGKVREVIRR